MSDRAALFLFSLFMVIVSLAAAAWLLVSGQAGYVDGLFLMLTCLLVALAFALYLMYMINRAKESLKPAAPAKAPAATAKAAAKPATSSQPVETS
jgi:hypothetical protein